MDKSNLELFKQAISEGLSNKFDSVVNGCTEEIVCSDRHKLAMRTIIYGKVETERVRSPKMKRIIAILIAAALLLTGCGIIFRNEIREIMDEFFVKYIYSGDGTNDGTIEEVYELTYLPDGYILEKENISDLSAIYKFVDSDNNVIKFEQRILQGSDFTIDSESGYSQIKEIEEYDVYYRYTETYHHYIWTNGNYTFDLMSNPILTNEEVYLIVNGIK